MAHNRIAVTFAGTFSLVVVGCFSSHAYGACAGSSPMWTSTADSSSVQTCINNASSGDVINVLSGSATWSSVTIPATKGLTLAGGSGGTTTIAGNIALTIASNSSVGTRVTGFTFTAAGSPGNANIELAGSANSAPYRIDDNIFINTAQVVFIEVAGNGPGLIDHNTFTGGGASEEVHNLGMGAGSEAGWTDSITPGGSNMVYLENNTFSTTSTTFICSGIESYYGARTVLRDNQFQFCQIDQHGTAGSIGARWWEIYNNTFNVPANLKQCCDIVVRDGTGVIWGNTQNLGSGASGGDIELYSDNSGAWPLAWQIGAGITDDANGYSVCRTATAGPGTGLNASPAYVWGNSSSIPVDTNGNPSGTVFINQDFFVSTTQPLSMQWQEKTGDTCSTSYTYAPFTYPYPLTASGLPNPSGTPATQPPTTPTNLNATAVSSSQINLNWTASTDGIGVSGYTVYRNSTKIGTSPTNSYSDTGLSPATSYTYAVSAYDAAGNNSPQSISATAATLSQGTTISQGTTTFISSGRMIDWTHAGIPGGIPSANWPIYATLSPSGGADDSVAIQTAINAAPAGSAVMLNPGTYTLHRSSTVCYGKADDYATGVYEAGLCLTDKSVVLRGAGPNQTILNYGDGANIISMGQTYLSSSSITFIPVTSTASQGATQVTLQSISGITTNSYIVVTQTNPTDTDGNPLVSVNGYTGACDYCGHDLPNNVMSQIDKVIAISGNTVTLERPLYFNYTNSPQVYHLPMIESVGLENLRVTGTAESGTALEFKNINLEACAHCWVHNVESDWAVDKSNIYLSDVYGSEISNNYLYEGFDHNSGGNYSLLLEFRNSENLIQNNIIRKARHSTPQSGSSGNVYAYNYELDAYMGEYPNSLPETNGHAAHPFMNLWEGNVTPNIEFDFAHGSSSHNTLFRNYIDLTSTNPSTGKPMTDGVIALNVTYYSNYENVVGNVFGPSSACTATTYETQADVSKVNGVIYQVGYYDDGTGTSPNLTLSAKVGSTLIRGGNWDCVSKSVVWSTNVPPHALTSGYLAQQILPNSLYLSSTPNWFTATGAVFPPINPTGSTIVNPIPAQICYNREGLASGAAFNPVACYTTTSTTPQIPTNLTAVVH